MEVDGPTQVGQQARTEGLVRRAEAARLLWTADAQAALDAVRMQVGAHDVEYVQWRIELPVEVRIQPALLAQQLGHRMDFAGGQADEGVEGIVGVAVGGDRAGFDRAGVDHEARVARCAGAQDQGDVVGLQRGAQLFKAALPR
ncbi:hypothetical protein D3C85_1181870 [compost metagenome]